MKKHTTGVIFAEGTTVYIDKKGTGRRIAECYAEHLNEDYLTGLREAEANARLFAAAAGLYDALSAVSELNSNRKWLSWIATIECFIKDVMAQEDEGDYTTAAENDKAFAHYLKLKAALEDCNKKAILARAALAKVEERE